MELKQSSHSSTSRALVIAAHGIPPSDYPGMKVGLLMMLEIFNEKVRWGFLEKWHARLDHEVRTWERTPQTDPYQSAVEKLARRLSERLEIPVYVGYNEFCAPTVAEAIEQALSEGATTVTVVSTMLIRGNTHTESEIAETVHQVAQSHPEAKIHYAFPVDEKLVIDLLATHVQQFEETA